MLISWRIGKLILWLSSNRRNQTAEKILAWELRTTVLAFHSYGSMNTSMKPIDCIGPISILKRLLTIAEIPAGEDIQVIDSGRPLSLIHSNLETILAFLQKSNQNLTLKMIQKRSDGKSSEQF